LPSFFLTSTLFLPGHTQAVDYWALGILIYELLCGGTPFADPSQSKIFEKIVKSKDYLKFPRVSEPLQHECMNIDIDNFITILHSGL
jgi:serine/threonine protein kinase